MRRAQNCLINKKQWFVAEENFTKNRFFNDVFNNVLGSDRISRMLMLMLSVRAVQSGQEHSIFIFKAKEIREQSQTEPKILRLVLFIFN